MEGGVKDIMSEGIDFTYHELAQISYPGHAFDGAIGKIEAIVFAYVGWPCDLLYLQLVDGEQAGKVIRVLANRCVAVEGMNGQARVDHTECAEPAIGGGGQGG